MHARVAHATRVPQLVMTSPGEQQPALGRVVGRGASWSILSTFWAKGASFAAQIVLAYLLSEGDWGVYAIGISFGNLVMTLRDGGANELIVQRGPRSYSSYRGPVFWMALAINSLIAGLLALIAPFVAAFYGEPEVASILQVLALAVLLDTPALLLRAKLRIDLRFGVLSRMEMASSIVRYGGVICLAIYGMGPLSFVLPLPVISLLETLVLYLAARDTPWQDRPGFRRWRALLGDIKWLVFGSFSTMLMAMGDYLVLGRMVPAEIVGIYYFSFQLGAHVTMLGTANVGLVLMPTLARLVAQPDRLRRATLRSLRSITLVVAPISLGLTATIAPLETAIWGGAWLSAVACVQILCVVQPICVTYRIATSTLKARGRFRAWALLTFVYGLGLMVAAVFAGYFAQSVTGIAAVIAFYLAIASPAILWAALRDMDIDLRDLFSALLPAWLIGGTVAGVCLALDHYLLLPLAAPSRLVAISSTFAVLYGVLCRTLIAPDVADLLSILPHPVAVVGRRVLRFPEEVVTSL